MSEAPDHEARHRLIGVDDLVEILDTLPSLVVVVDAEERNAYANRAAGAWLGRTPAQLLGTPVRELLDGESYAAVEDRVRGALAGTRQAFERSMRLPDGTCVHTLTEYLPRFRDGLPDGFIAVVTDVIQQARAEQEHRAARHREAGLREAHRAAAGAGDDLLQELFAIGLRLERMRGLPDDGSGIDSLVVVVANTIDRLREVIKLLVAGAEGSAQDGTIASASATTGGPSVVRNRTRREGGAEMDAERADDYVVELTVDECWDMLEADEFGRLAYRLVDEVHLVPINYLVDDRSLMFRTASGSKLLAAALHSDVALEIDWHDDLAAWSVVVRGQLRRLAEDEQYRVDALPRRSWIPTLTYDVVELVPSAVTGRRFRLRRGEPDHELAGR